MLRSRKRCLHPKIIQHCASTCLKKFCALQQKSDFEGLRGFLHGYAKKYLILLPAYNSSAFDVIQRCWLFSISRLDCSFEREKKQEEWIWRFQNCCLSLVDQKLWCNWSEGQFKWNVFHHLSPLSFKWRHSVILSCYRSP